MGNADQVLSKEQIAAYELMPIPFCILHAKADTYVPLALSDGLCQLLHLDRSRFMNVPNSLLQLVVPDDRETMTGALEYARVQPGVSGHVSCHLQAQDHRIKADCITFGRQLEDDSYLIDVYFSNCMEQEDSSDLSIAQEKQMLAMQAEAAGCVISEWLIDLTDQKTISFRRHQERALTIDPPMTYEEAAACVASSASNTADQKRLAAMLDRDCLLQNYSEGHTSFQVEYRRNEDGKMPFWVSTSVQTYFAPADGHVEGKVTTYDITEKILEKQLISRFTMLGYDVVGILGVPSRKVRFFRLKPMHFRMNYEHYQDYLTSIEEDVNRVVAPEQRKAVSQALRLETILNALQESSNYGYSFEVTTSDGRHRHKLLQYSYLDESHDTIFLCRSDVTSQYQREHEQIEELRAAKLEADRANEAKSTFLSSVSHDLRTPLNGVVGFTELALNEKDPAKKQEYLNKIKSSGILLLDLVNDTLELSRIESGKSICMPEAVSLRAMSEAVVTSLQPSAEIKNLKFEADLSRCPDVTVWTDRLKFQKIFLNLISNAVKYTPSGGTVWTQVNWIEKEGSENLCELIIKDSGIGIRPEFLPHIFESFSQDNRPETANIQGTGLGLAIVKRMVTLLHGEISVESTVNVGTTFKVTLPIALADQQQKAEETSTANFSLEGRHVLLCEDNPLNTEIAKVMLNGKGVIVETAADGSEGTEMFAKSPAWHYDAVFMDIRMPVMDGFDAARTIRSMEREDALITPIIAMTADAFEEDIHHCYEAGMNRHITKPINPDLLFSTLIQCINAAEKERPAAASDPH